VTIVLTQPTMTTQGEGEGSRALAEQNPNLVLSSKRGGEGGGTEI
jgi:hypothetical protein